MIMAIDSSNYSNGRAFAAGKSGNDSIPRREFQSAQNPNVTMDRLEDDPAERPVFY
jgi:hypothetical protein